MGWCNCCLNPGQVGQFVVEEHTAISIEVPSEENNELSKETNKIWRNFVKKKEYDTVKKK